MFLYTTLMLLYSLGAGFAVDKIGPRSPFVIVGIMDFAFAFFVFYQIKKYNW